MPPEEPQSATVLLPRPSGPASPWDRARPHARADHGRWILAGARALDPAWPHAMASRYAAGRGHSCRHPRVRPDEDLREVRGPRPKAALDPVAELNPVDDDAAPNSCQV